MGGLSLSNAPIIFCAAILSVSTFVALVSAALHDADVWRRAGFSPNAKLMWLVLCALFGPIAGISYLIGVRPKLRAASSAG